MLLGRIRAVGPTLQQTNRIGRSNLRILRGIKMKVSKTLLRSTITEAFASFFTDEEELEGLVDSIIETLEAEDDSIENEE